MSGASATGPHVEHPCACGCGETTTRARYRIGHHGRKSPVDYLVDSETGCWEWQGATQRNGYGVLRRKGKNFRAHRYYYQLERGPVPAGMDLDHLCRNRACCNPAHMEVVTRAENLRRGENTTLTVEEVRDIKRILSEPDPPTHRSLAAWFGIGERQIGYIATGQCWKDVAA